jgi:hypothetical protein
MIEGGCRHRPRRVDEAAEARSRRAGLRKSLPSRCAPIPMMWIWLVEVSCAVSPPASTTSAQARPRRRPARAVRRCPVSCMPLAPACARRGGRASSTRERVAVDCDGAVPSTATRGGSSSSKHRAARDRGRQQPCGEPAPRAARAGRDIRQRGRRSCAPSDAGAAWRQASRSARPAPERPRSPGGSTCAPPLAASTVPSRSDLAHLARVT